MTANEIIKALRFCSDPDTCSYDCSFYVEGETVHECTTKLSVAALDLIRRQQAEIEDWKAENARMCAERDAHIVTNNFIKDKAVKEFAEKLKNEIISETAYGCDINQHSGYYDYLIKIGDIPEYIDNLVKEMVGESDGR